MLLFPWWSAGMDSWWRLCGLLPGLDMRSCLCAQASGTQARLLEAVLPEVPWAAAADEEAGAPPEARGGAMGLMGRSAAAGSCGLVVYGMSWW